MNEEPAVGGKGQYIVDNYLKGKGKSKSKAKQGKGKEEKGMGMTEEPAVGGVKGNGAWMSSTLHIVQGTWKYREASCLDLATFFFELGKGYTATQLYRYWNTLPPLATKRPHAWGSPWVQQAAHERFQKTGYYAH